nr:zeta toxin family protein [Streptomonospora nanhaiensis]
MAEKDLARLFTEYVQPHVFGPHKPSTEPVLVLLGAQPAAGKSRAQQLIARAHPDIVSLTGDDLRPIHPAYDDLMATDPLAMPNATSQASGRWVAMSIDHAREHGYSLLLEGIFRDPDMTVGTAAAFAPTHRVEVVSLAVPEEISRLDSVGRYLAPSGAPARWTPAGAHDLGYRMSPQTVQACEDSEHVQRITITDRSGAELFTNERGPNSAWTGPTGARDTLLHARQLRLEPGAARDWLARREDYTAAMVQRGELNETTLPTFERLHTDADRVAAHAYPDSEDAPLKRRHDASQHVHRYILDSAASGIPPELVPAPQTFLASDRQLAEHGGQNAEVERERQRRALLAPEHARLEDRLRRRARRALAAPQHESPQRHNSARDNEVRRPRDHLHRSRNEPEPGP